jgi:hypothetical protein
MGLFRALTDVIYKEYDRRIRRASLIKEYGIEQHNDHADESHAAEEHKDEDAAESAGESHAAEEHAAEDEAEIANVPPGTPIAAPTPAPTEPAEPDS